MTPVASRRAAKRRYYRAHRMAILRQQQQYRAVARRREGVKVRLAENTHRWRERFKDWMRRNGYPGRTGDGLSPEGYRYRVAQGLPVPPWPTLIDASKQRRPGIGSVDVYPRPVGSRESTVDDEVAETRAAHPLLSGRKTPFLTHLMHQTHWNRAFRWPIQPSLYTTPAYVLHNLCCATP